MFGNQTSLALLFSLCMCTTFELESSGLFTPDILDDRHRAIVQDTVNLRPCRGDSGYSSRSVCLSFCVFESAHLEAIALGLYHEYSLIGSSFKFGSKVSLSNKSE